MDGLSKNKTRYAHKLYQACRTLWVEFSSKFLCQKNLDFLGRIFWVENFPNISVRKFVELGPKIRRTPWIEIFQTSLIDFFEFLRSNFFQLLGSNFFSKTSGQNVFYYFGSEIIQTFRIKNFSNLG